MDHSHTARLIEFLSTTKTRFVPEVVVRPEAIMKSFAQAINSADVEPGDPSIWDSLVLESAVNTDGLPPADHYNLAVVALDYIVREGQGFDSAYADHLLYIMLRYLPKLPTFDPHFRHRGAAALSLLLYRDVGLHRLDARSHFTIAYLLMHHCRAAVSDLPRRVAKDDDSRAEIEDGVSKEALRDAWHHWFKHDDLDNPRFDALVADMAAWHAQLAADRPADSSNG